MAKVFNLALPSGTVALTQDGEGEVVGGLVMMLKGANSNDVIERVKERMAAIQKSLPEGVNNPASFRSAANLSQKRREQLLKTYLLEH